MNLAPGLFQPLWVPGSHGRGSFPEPYGDATMILYQLMFDCEWKIFILLLIFLTLCVVTVLSLLSQQCRSELSWVNEHEAAVWSKINCLFTARWKSWQLSGWKVISCESVARKALSQPLLPTHQQCLFTQYICCSIVALGILLDRRNHELFSFQNTFLYITIYTQLAYKVGRAIFIIFVLQMTYLKANSLCELMTYSASKAKRCTCAAKKQTVCPAIQHSPWSSRSIALVFSVEKFPSQAKTSNFRKTNCSHLQ